VTEHAPEQPRGRAHLPGPLRGRALVPDRLRGRAELGLAALVLGVGVFLLLQTSSIRVPATANAVGPRFFPYVVGGMLVLAGLALAVTVWRRGSDEPEGGEDVDPTAPTDWKALALLAAAFVAHILLLEPLGFVFTEALLFAAVSWVLGDRGRWWRPPAIGLALALVAYLAFSRALGVALPAGVLEGVL
jgi:putative tricarboxylic transport membrane protein